VVCFYLDEWVKFILHSELSTLLQDPQLKANEISSCLAEKGIGFRLHNADLVLIPLRKNSYWYLVVANFRDHRKFSRLYIPDQPEFTYIVCQQLLEVFQTTTTRSCKGKESLTYYLCTHEENEVVPHEGIFLENNTEGRSKRHW